MAPSDPNFGFQAKAKQCRATVISDWDSVSLSGQTTNYVSSVGYWPNSAPQTMAYGNGLTRSFTFNARNQPTQIMDASSAGTLLQLNLGWGDGAGSASHNIGRLRSQQISAPAVSFTQSYVYDPLKRLQSVTDTAAGTSLQRRGRATRVRGASKVMAHLMFGILALTVDQLLRLAG